MKFVNTESVFEVIGNQPVLDQFDVSYSLLMSGTTLDNYVTGSLLKAIKLQNKVQLVPGERGVVFSKVGVDRSAVPSYDSDILPPWYERAGIIRNLKIFSDNERYYDSLVPRISDCLAKVGGKIFINDGIAVGMQPNVGFLSFNVDPSGGYFKEGSFAANGWHFEFPFSSKFSDIVRTREPASTIIATKIKTGGTINPYPTDNTFTYSDTNAVVKLIYIVDDNYINVSPANYGTQLDNLIYKRRIFFSNGDSTGYIPIETKDVLKIIFGFGTLSDKIQKYSGKNYLLGSIASVHSRSYPNIMLSLFTNAMGPIVSGWKYGLVSALPYYTSAVFRRNRFGQMRDMLEQRSCAFSISDFKNSPSLSFDEKEGSPIPYPSQQPGQSIFEPVSVRFVKQAIINNKLKYEQVNPYDTAASNMSTFVTSSLPYFDGQARNR
jgi:hypothetical protein